MTFVPFAEALLHMTGTVMLKGAQTWPNKFVNAMALISVYPRMQSPRILHSEPAGTRIATCFTGARCYVE